MSFAFVASESGTDNTSGTTLDCTGSLNIVAGDVLIVAGSWETSTTTIAVQSTDTDNAMTMLAVASTGVNNNFVALGYILVGELNGTATFRMTLGAARGYRSLGVFQFRPDGGDTCSLESGPSANDGTGEAMTTGSITPTGDDIIVVATAKNYLSTLFNTEEIGGSSADGALDMSNFAGMWYTLYTAAPGAITGTANGMNSVWVADILAIKAVAAGGGLPIPVAMYYRRLMANVIANAAN